MRIVFMGTSGFAAPILSALHRRHQIIAVVTQPDRPTGRGQRVSESPIKREAVTSGLTVYQPERVREESFIGQLQTLGPIDVIVVAAFGQIIPKAILDLPRLGCVNAHASLLPKCRGAAPIQHALIQGETITGVTTMLMDPGVDTGPILLQQETDIAPDETAGELEIRLSDMAADLVPRTLDRLEDGSLTPTPQDDSKATLARPLRRKDAEVQWSTPARDIVNRIRAFTPRPGAYTTLQGSYLKIWRAAAIAEQHSERPGLVIAISDSGIKVAAGISVVMLIEVQPENRNRMRACDFARGSRLAPGANLGPDSAVEE